MARKKAKALPPRTITVYAEILQKTEDALLVRCDAEADGVWLPKSQIEYAGERGDTGVEIRIPDWLADEKGFFDGMGRPEPAAAPAEPEQPETVTLTGSVMNYHEVKNGEARKLIFAIGHEDETGNYDETEYTIPLEKVLSKEFNEDDVDKITISRAYAVELGLARPAEEAADHTPPARRNFGDNVKWLKEERITVSAPLSTAEKASYAEEMAALDGEIEALKGERAEVSNRLKKQIDAKEEERLALSRAVNEGETREVLCDCLKDYNTEEMVWTNAYPPYEEVLRRKMTGEEKQPSLLEFQEKNGQTPPPAGEGEGEGMDFDAMSDQPGETAASPTMDDGANEPPAEPESEPEADPREAA